MHRMLTEISLPACIRCWNCIYTSKKLFFLNLMGPLLLLKPVEIEKIKATEMCMKHYIHFLCTSNWSHDHHHCGRCKVLYLATNVCSTKKKKKKMLCACAALSSMCVYIVTKQSFHFSFHSAELCSYIKIKYFASECRFYTEHECGLTTVV